MSDGKWKDLLAIGGPLMGRVFRVVPGETVPCYTPARIDAPDDPGGAEIEVLVFDPMLDDAQAVGDMLNCLAAFRSLTPGLPWPADPLAPYRENIVDLVDLGPEPWAKRLAKATAGVEVEVDGD